MSEQAATADAPEAKEPSAAEKKRREAEAFYAQELAEEEIAKLSASRFTSMIRGTWSQADPNTKGFLTGISNIADIAPVKRAAGALEFTSVSGSKFTWMPAGVDRATNKPTQEFIGLTVGQAKNQPLTEQIADDIAQTAMLRGWKKIDVHGSVEEREMLWLSAMKHGLEVSNFKPGPETLKKWVDFQQEERAAQATQDAPANSDNMPAPAGLSGSRFAPEKDDNVVDAEWEEVKPISGFLPAPEQKNEGPKDTPDAGGPKRLPPPPKGP